MTIRQPGGTADDEFPDQLATIGEPGDDARPTDSAPTRAVRAHAI